MEAVFDKFVVDTKSLSELEIITKLMEKLNRRAANDTSKFCLRGPTVLDLIDDILYLCQFVKTQGFGDVTKLNRIMRLYECVDPPIKTIMENTANNSDVGWETLVKLLQDYEAEEAKMSRL